MADFVREIKQVLDVAGAKASDGWLYHTFGNTAALCEDACGSSSSDSRADAVHGGCRCYFALLLSHHKLLCCINSTDAVKDYGIFDKAASMLFPLGISEHLMPMTPALPWLLLLARCSSASAQQAAAALSDLQQAANAAEGQPDASVLHVVLTQVVDMTSQVLDLFNWLSHHLDSSSSRKPECDGICEAAVVPAAVMVLLRPELAKLLQHWKQEMLPTAQAAARLYQYCSALIHQQSANWGLPVVKDTVIETRAAMSAGEAAVADSLDAAASHGQAMELLASHPLYGVCLLQQLEAAANQLCALLPLPLCCNNPGCDNVSKQSELQLVSGKACMCAGCEVARYCGRECQAAHWQAHKRVCKLIRKSKAAAGDVTAASPNAASEIAPTGHLQPQP